MDSRTNHFEISIPQSVPATIVLLAIIASVLVVGYQGLSHARTIELRKLEYEKSKSPDKSGEALTQNGGKLRSEQQGNVHYFYQVDATNGTRIPLPDYKVMLNAFESTARQSGPVVSISPEIVPYNGRLAYMGMWVTFMPGKPIELIPR